MNKRYNQIVHLYSNQGLFWLIMNHERIVLWRFIEKIRTKIRFIHRKKCIEHSFTHKHTHIQIFFILFNWASEINLAIFMKYAGMFSGIAYGMALFKNSLKRVDAGKRNFCARKLQGLFVFQNGNMKLNKENLHSPFSSTVICKFHYKTEYCNTKLVYNVIYTAPYSYIWLCNVLITVIILYLLLVKSSDDRW